MAKCFLCLKDEKVLIDSHIFPEFLYNPLYDENHQYLVVSSDSSKKIKKPRKGIYEKLFCRNCEDILEKYEDYAAKILFDDGKTKTQVEHTKSGFLFKGINYKKFKLFQMSLLWRASIANRKEIHEIDLGPHSEKLRNMIYHSNPGEPHDYGAGLFFVPDYSKDFKAFIYPPEEIPKKIEGHRWYRAIFNGILWFFIVSNHSNRFSRKHIFLDENGNLPINNLGQKGKIFIESLSIKMSKGSQLT